MNKMDKIEAIALIVDEARKKKDFTSARLLKFKHACEVLGVDPEQTRIALDL